MRSPIHSFISLRRGSVVHFPGCSGSKAGKDEWKRCSDFLIDMVICCIQRPRQPTPIPYLSRSRWWRFSGLAFTYQEPLPAYQDFEYDLQSGDMPPATDTGGSLPPPAQQQRIPFCLLSGHEHTWHPQHEEHCPLREGISFMTWEPLWGPWHDPSMDCRCLQRLPLIHASQGAHAAGQGQGTHSLIHGGADRDTWTPLIPNQSYKLDTPLESHRTAGLANGYRFFVGSPFASRKVGQSGLDMSAPWVHLAYPDVADEWCNYRGCQAESLNHPEALFHMNTGSRLGADPALGSWVTYGLGSINLICPVTWS